MKILSLDSSATCASVSIFDTDQHKIIGEFFINTKLTHSQTLMPMVDAVLNSTNTKLEDIDLFAVNTGPGSFTGIRIGVSAVKGMAMALNKPCASVSTLHSMAYNFIDYDDVIVCACMDARRNQVYNALFKISGGTITRICDDRAISIENLYAELSSFEQEVVLVGDGAALVNNSNTENSNIELAVESRRYQTASSVAMCACEYINTNNLLSASQLMPTYLRPSQAERERENKEKE
ncbi:MAG: tRNA (adenosine(37)-N6)-threonylcarbamoyltransferase complex dimerization subunit type 1 TsaB [Eubacteriales bacterium]|nr:tRNA (adenosine(37)-N6)-threonylcarbamoyltransferase complex dimerization subunit type 1 TsaB [Eubacteriales bacterium]